jgi:hypothetical protein
MRIGMAFTAMVLATASAAFGSDFTYKVPDGFRELRTQSRPGDVDESKIPPQMVKDALNPRYILVAIDPLTTTRNEVGATFNVVEMKSTGHMTLDTAKKAADGIAASFKAKGLSTSVVSVNVASINNVDTGVITLDLDDGTGARRTRQYVLPGLHGAAILSYSAPRADFESYYPSFLRSLRATRGAAEPVSEPARFNWTEFFLSGLIGGLIGVAGFGIKKFLGKRTEKAGEVAAADEAPKKTPPRRASKHLWYCDDCGKPVPIRLDECRCGGKKTA